jgi:cobalt-zinc-cadmium efflux system protein
MSSHAGHSHGLSGGDASREAQRRALWIALGLNGAFLFVELGGGLAFNSLALLADAAHMLSDVVGLGVALIAQQLLSRPATAKHSYGLQRAEVLGAQFNGITLLVVAVWIIYEAVGRIGDPLHVEGAGMLVVASLGLAINVASAILLARSQGRSLNMHGAFLHMALDAAGSVGAMVAAIAVIVWNAAWVDPVVSIGIAVMVLWSAWGLLRQTTHVLLEGAPGDVRLDEIEATLSADPIVEGVHHTHVWSLASDVTAFSGHVVLKGEPSLHDAQREGERLKHLLSDTYGIDHATLELECHTCADPDPEHASAVTETG